MAASLTFWHCAGDIIWRGDARPTPISEAQAQALRGLYSDEALANFKAGNCEIAARASALLGELTRALDELGQWRRICRSTPREVWPYDRIGTVVSAIIERFATPDEGAAHG